MTAGRSSEGRATHRCCLQLWVTAGREEAVIIEVHTTGAPGCREGMSQRERKLSRSRGAGPHRAGGGIVYRVSLLPFVRFGRHTGVIQGKATERRVKLVPVSLFLIKCTSSAKAILTGNAQET